MPTERATPSGPPGLTPDSQGEPAPDPCLDVVDVLNGFCLVEKRSATLDGSLEARAARGCQPMLEGNAAGFQLRLAEPAVLQPDGDGTALEMTDGAYAKTAGVSAATLDELVERGLLVRNGHWHRRLRRGFAWQRGNVLSLWTGLLVRPRPDCWLLQSGAYTRRSRVAVAEAVIVDDGSFVPVVLDLDLSSVAGRVTWLDSELGCLTPLRPDVRVTICSLEEDPEVGHAANRFYHPDYRDQRGAMKATGAYRRLTADDNPEPAEGPGECRLVVGGGPKLHRTGTFRRFLTSAGSFRHNPTPQELQFGVVRNICAVGGRWDGQSLRDLWPDEPPGAARFRRRWAQLYGEEQLENIDWIMDYLGEYPPAPIRGEPYLQLTAWVFARTPPGWSSVVDGYHRDGIDGMRGVIASDSFHLLAPIGRFHQPCTFEIPRGAPLERVLPVPRQLLRAPVRRLSVDGNLLEPAPATTRRPLRPAEAPR